MENKKIKINDYELQDTYAWNETILTNLDVDSIEFNLFSKIVQELKLKIYRMEHSADIIAVPYFLFVINPDKLRKEDIETLDYWMPFCDKKEVSIIFTKKPNFKPFQNIKKFCIKNTNIYEYEKNKLMILNLRSRLKLHTNKKINYDKKIFRLFYMLQLLLENKNNYSTDYFCREFNVSEKTIHRDIEMLRSMGNDIIYDRNNKTWKMTFCQHKFDLNY